MKLSRFKQKKVIVGLVLIWYIFIFAVIALSLFISQTGISIGERVNVNDEDSKNFIGFGENITLDKPINQNVLLAGENIQINSNIKGNAAIGGENLLIDGTIDGKVFVGGELLNITQKAEIKGKSWFGLNELIIDGNLYDDVRIDANVVTLNGNILANISINADKVVINGKVEGNLKVKADNVEITEKAVISHLSYDVDDIKIAEGAQILTSVEQDLSELEIIANAEFTKLHTPLIITSYTIKLILTIILFYLFKDRFRRCKDLIQNDIRKVLKKGLIVEFGLLALIIVSAITIIGIPFSILLGLLLWIAWELVLSCTAIITALFIESRLKSRNVKFPLLGLVILSFFGLLLIFRYLPSGGFLYFLAGIFSFGSIYLVRDAKGLEIEV